jgi:Retrotransposon gag protein
MRVQLDCQNKPRSASPSKDVRSEFILTKDIRPQDVGSGSQHPHDGTSSQRIDRHQPPRADCPGFNGDNVIEWIRRCNSLFEMYQVPPPYKTKLATMQFAGPASEWYDCFLIDHDPPDWTDMVRRVRKRFQLRITKNGMKELIELHQSGNVGDYIERFDRLRARLLLENTLFSESDFVDAFIGVLKLELKVFVKVFKPQNLEDIYDHACN